MKRIFVLLLLLFVLPVSAETLRGSTSYTEQLSGFFGTWHVTSKIESSNNYPKFNKLSVDIWNLSGQGNVLILENELSGATSSIQLDEKADNLDGKKLKFTRIKEFSDGKHKYRHVESPEFILDGKIFKGYDTFKVETYSLNGELISVDVVKYKVIGQKIAGD